MVDSIIQSFDIWTNAQGLKSKGRVKSVDNISIEGIARLRELILDLAIRGKLLPQNNSDSSVDKLINEINLSRKSLIEQGKLRAQKPIPEISNIELKFDIPNNWKFARFGEVTFNRDFERIPLSVSDRKNRQGTYDYYGASGVIDQIDDYLFDKPLLLLGEDGANLINRSSPIAFIAKGKYWVNNHAHVIDGLSEDMLNYICLHINAISLVPFVTGTAQPKMNQAKMNSIVLAIPPLEEQKRIVAKVDELMALCDKLEEEQTNKLKTHQLLVKTILETLTRAKDAKELQAAWQRMSTHFDTLFCTEDSIDQLKQTILQLAVMGKLVKQDPNDLPANPQNKFFVYVLECSDGSWYKGFTKDIIKRWKEHASGKGAEHTKKYPPVKLIHWEVFDNEKEAVKREKYFKTGAGREWLKRNEKLGQLRQAGEPAKILLEKIAAEKAKLIKEGKIKKQKALPEISDEEKPFELPKGWEFARLIDLCELITKGSSPKWQGVSYTENTSDVLFVTSENVGSYKLIFDNKKYVEKKFNDVEPRSVLHQGDFLMNIVGGSIGRTAIYNLTDLANINQAVCLIRTFSQLIEPSFLLHFFNSEVCVSYMFDKQVDNARANLSMGNISKFVIPFPSLVEQIKIVEKIAELFTLCDSLKEKIQKSQEIKNELSRAVVEKAVQ